MTEINSPLGRQRLAASASRKVLTVPDSESDLEPDQLDEFDDAEFERMQRLREQKAQEMKRVSSTARERLMILGGLGRCVETLTVDGVTFTLRSLKADEMKEVVRLSKLVDSVQESYFEARNQTLARAIQQIDGQPISLVFGTKDKDYASIINCLGEMDHQLIEFIHDRYLDMINRNKQKFTIKDAADAKEVSEDIKK